jgi:hypothetical protein
MLRLVVVEETDKKENEARAATLAMGWARVLCYRNRKAVAALHKS